MSSIDPAPMAPLPDAAAPVVEPTAVVGDAVLSLGDSIAAGIGARHVSEGCMPLLLARLRAMRATARLHNLAIPGETTTSMLGVGGQLTRAEALLAELTDTDLRVAPVLLSIGGNDAMQAAAIGDELARRRLRANLEEILGRLDAALESRGGLGGRAAIQTIYNPFEPLDDGASHEQPQPSRWGRGGYNRVLRECAARHGLVVAEVATAFAGRAAELTWIRSGDIHPTGLGHAVIAEAYLAALRLG